MAKVYNRDGQCDPIRPSREYGEWTIYNKERIKPMSGPKGLDEVAGNGKFGFLSRRAPKGVRMITIQLPDGPLDKPKRKTVCRPRKNPCKLASRVEINRSIQEFPEKIKAQKKEEKRRMRNAKRAASRQRQKG
jgi:hypothetical protein